MSAVHRVWFWVGELLLLLVFWALLVSKLDVVELAIGIVAAGLSAVVVTRVRGVRLAQFTPPARAVLQVWRLPGMVVLETVKVFAVLPGALAGRDLPGRIVRIGVQGGGKDARSAGKRALLVAELTTAPNSVVIGLDRQAQGDDALLVHELVPSDVQGTLGKLGLS